MDPNAYLWQVQQGRLPAPQAAQTLGMRITHVDPKAGVLEADFSVKPISPTRRVIF